jgi:hypothetical protein
MTTLARRVLGAALALAAPALVLIAYAALRDRLPAPLAVHWDLHGRVDNTAGVGGFFLGTRLAAAVLALAAAAVSLGVRSPIAGRMLGALLTFGAWMAAATWTVTAAVSADVQRAADTDIRWYAVLFVVLGPILLGILAWLVLPGTWQHPDAPAPTTALSFAPGEAVVWVDRVGTPWVRQVSAAAAVAAVVLFWVARPVMIPLAIVAVVLALASEITVRIDGHGVHTLWGPFGWPRQRIPLELVTGARVERIRPLEWGGWGYRVSPRGVAAVIRSGPGLVVSRSGRPDYAVTIPHAAAGADVLNALIARERSRSQG